MTGPANPPVFIVTGASRGIGQAIVQELLRRGARVLEVARKPGISLPMSVEASTGNCHYLQADVTVEKDRCRIIEQTKGVFGRIDGLINNAGQAFRALSTAVTLRKGCRWRQFWTGWPVLSRVAQRADDHGLLRRTELSRRSG